MNIRVLFLGLVAIVVTSQPIVAGAQVVDESKVRAFIEQNGELLEVAATLVQETNSTKARGSLETARALHAQSVDLLEKNTPGMAARVALRAREVIQQTIAIAKREARIEEQALKAIERASIRLEQARSAFEDAGSNDAAARRLIQEAADNLRRAREQLQQHTFEVSLKLADSSVSLSMRALRLLRRDTAGSADAQDEIERTEQVLERLADARPTLPPALLRLADQATDLQRRARLSEAEGNDAIAHEQTLAARTLALRALRAGSGGGAGAENAERAVTTTDEILERARELARESGDRAIVDRIADAARAQDVAKQALERSDFESALRQTTRAREIVRDALDESGDKVAPVAVESALTRTDELLSRLQNALTAHDDVEARAMLQRARNRQDEARRAFSEEHARRAMALTKVAYNLAREGLQRLGDAGL